MKKKEDLLEGWIRTSAGESRRIDYNKRFSLYVRRRKLSDILPENADKRNLSTSGNISSQENNGMDKGTEDVSNLVSGSTMEIEGDVLTPNGTSCDDYSGRCSSMKEFSSYPSLTALRSEKDSLLIGFDSQYYYDTEGHRRMLSWSFSVALNDDIYEFLFIKTGNYDITLELCLGRILDSLRCFNPIDIRNVRRYKCLGNVNSRTNEHEVLTFNSQKEALSHATGSFKSGKKVESYLYWKDSKYLDITLVCHSGRGDVCSFDQSGYYCKDILKYMSDIQGGLVSLRPILIYPSSVNPLLTKTGRVHKYPVRLNFADAVCHTPGDFKSLDQISNVIGIYKDDLPSGIISRLDILLREDPGLYFNNACIDCLIPLLYVSKLYGFNKSIPVTITSVSAKVIKKSVMSYLDCKDDKEFDRKYRGLVTVNHGNVSRKDKIGYISNTSKEPISDKARVVQEYAALAYHGGYNISSKIGYFPEVTLDYDLRNAYPTSMCLVPDVDWEDPVRCEITNRELTLNDFTAEDGSGLLPVAMMFAYVRFEFPENALFPCIPVVCDGIPVYPRTSKGVDGVYACGPELFLALQLGASIFVEKGYVLNTLMDEAGNPSFSLRVAVEQMVRDRAKAKKEFGDKSLEELILKVMVNAGYGKTAQNVVRKHTWSAYKNSMEDIGCSAITNPVSACMTTSIVRAVIIAAQNQCHEAGYMSCSATTDGFITNIPMNTLKKLDLYGFRTYMEESRLYLTGNDPELWEVKHVQDDLLNITTRGNVSLYCKEKPFYFDGKKYNGVCAHNSCKSGFVPDSYDDRIWLMVQVLSRTGRVEYNDIRVTEFRELVKGKEYESQIVTLKKSMDFDMKRKPDINSFIQTEVNLDGQVYTLVNFSTSPFDNISEFCLYRRKTELVSCLRTMNDWDLFWKKIIVNDRSLKIRDLDWAVLNSCIIGHRAGLWNIKKLEEFKGQARYDWINEHNTSSKKFTQNDWKNAGRKDRQKNILPREQLEEKLSELMGD